MPIVLGVNVGIYGTHGVFGLYMVSKTTGPPDHRFFLTTSGRNESQRPIQEGRLDLSGGRGEPSRPVRDLSVRFGFGPNPRDPVVASQVR